jgi:hypothetical protein
MFFFFMCPISFYNEPFIGFPLHADSFYAIVKISVRGVNTYQIEFYEKRNGVTQTVNMFCYTIFGRKARKHRQESYSM